jgi:hypothetical protein
MYQTLMLQKIWLPNGPKSPDPQTTNGSSSHILQPFKTLNPEIFRFPEAVLRVIGQNIT